MEKRSVDSLRLDPNNVRFRHLGRPLSDKEMEDLIWAETETKELFRSIVASGGLSEKPFILPNGIVKEGNRRLVAVRSARKMAHEGKLDPSLSRDCFDAIQVEVFDESITAEEIDIWLARVHVTGKKEWDALNQADQLWKLYSERGFSYERIRELLGMGKAEVIRKIQAYEATKDFLKVTGEMDIRKYSFFEELYKKKDLADRFELDPEFRVNMYDWISNSRFDASGAKDLRKLGEVLGDKDALRAFGASGMRAALFELQRKDPSKGSITFRATSAAIQALRSMPREELKQLKIKPEQIELLKSLRTEIDQVLEDVGV